MNYLQAIEESRKRVDGLDDKIKALEAEVARLRRRLDNAVRAARAYQCANIELRGVVGQNSALRAQLERAEKALRPFGDSADTERCLTAGVTWAEWQAAADYFKDKDGK